MNRLIDSPKLTYIGAFLRPIMDALSEVNVCSFSRKRSCIRFYASSFSLTAILINHRKRRGRHCFKIRPGKRMTFSFTERRTILINTQNQVILNSSDSTVLHKPNFRQNNLIFPIHRGDINKKSGKIQASLKKNS